MIAVRNDNAAAFGELVASYYERVRAWLEYLLRDAETATDLTQEVFLRVFRARKRYVPKSKFSTWLFHIANNLASNARRTLSRRREVDTQAFEDRHGSRVPLEAMTASREQASHDRIEGDENAELLRAAIAKLGQRQKTAIRLSVYRGMSHAQIAERMDTTTMAVKCLLARARNNLRTELEPHYADT